jgi:hypothetical protein
MVLPRFDFRAAPVATTENDASNERRYRAEVERAFRAGDMALTRIDATLSAVPMWGGAWAGAGSFYRAGAIVKDGLWLMIAKRDTNDRPAPDAPGGPSPDWEVMMKGVA